jgi:farnesyl diphosphate synthase
LSGQLDWELFLMTTGTALSDFAKRLDQTAEDSETLLGKLLSDALLPDEIARPKRLMDAMRYSSLGGGKRLRPFLVVESSAVFGVAREAALLAGAALECIHCYSLIHDDLPAMDNSDLRRGRPTLHKKTDDATAILAGDGLLTLAFDIITRDDIHKDPTVRLLLTRARVHRESAAWSAARCSISPAKAGSATASRSMSRGCSR